MGENALANFRTKVLIISLSSKLLSVLGTSENKNTMSLYHLTDEELKRFQWSRGLSSRAVAFVANTKM
jgi:hypothetical protein